MNIVVIGSSTGGPSLVEEIIAKLPPHFSTCLIFVQHMPQFFLEHFVRRLAKNSSTPIKLLSTNAQLTPGTIWFAPARYHIHLANQKITFTPFTENHAGPHPSINEVMTEFANTYTNKTIGVILTGMGEDGTIGAQHIKKNGGTIIAQDPENASVASMPRSIIEKQLADTVIRLPEQYDKLIQHII